MAASAEYPKQLAHYRLVGLLGAGAMGRVYRAEDTRLQRVVALKVLPDDVATDASWLDRFRREAQSVAALNHPNIVTIFSIEEADGRHFLTMELVEGNLLGEWASTTDVSPSRLAELATGLADALVALHASGIIHRDLKPSNIMITPEDRPKILDFGLAKKTGSALRAASSDAPTIAKTQPGALLGTINYMSPEQARGDEAVESSDIFSLGVILFELATGRAPFRGGKPAERLASLLRDRPQPISELVPGFPPRLAAIVERCLEPDPRHRVATAVELKTLLESYSRADRQDSRPTARSIAVLPFRHLSTVKDQEYFCDGLAEELIGALARIDGLRVVARSSAFRFRDADQDVREIGQQLEVEHLIEGTVRQAGERLRISLQLVSTADGCQIWQGRYDREMRDVFDVQEDIARRVVEELELELGEETERIVRPATENLDAYHLYLRGRFALNRRSADSLAESLRFFHQAIETAPAYARAFAGAADANALLCVYGVRPPDEVMPQALESARQAVEVDGNLAEAHVSLGYVRSLWLWDWEGAEHSFRRALEIDAKYPTAHHWFAMAGLLPTGRFDEAAEQLDRARNLDPLAPVIIVSRGLIPYFAHRFEEAVPHMEDAIRLDATFAFAHLSLGRVLVELEDYPRAIRSLERAAELSADSAETISSLGYAYARAGRFDDARQQLERLELLAERSWVPPSLVAQVHAGLGDRVRALELLEIALQRRVSDLAWLKYRPPFAALHNEARFVALLDRLHLSD